MKTTILIITFLSSLISLSSTAQDSNLDDAFSDAELAQMLAPIALYPDSVLTHVLIASTYPLEVIQAQRWLEDNDEIESEQAMELAEEKDWDASVKALVAFPDVLERLSLDLQWMQNIGDAFLQDEERLMASVQELRQQADDAGSFDDIDNMQVYREQGDIIIQPIERELVYVPYYDSRVVYGNWRWDYYPPVYWDRSWHRRHYSHISHHGLFSWYPGVHLSSHFFFRNFHWGNHHIIVADRHRYSTPRYRDLRQHRRHILGDYSSRRWQHNSHHRRGVAYRHHSGKRDGNRHNRDNYRNERKHASGDHASNRRDSKSSRKIERSHRRAEEHKTWRKEEIVSRKFSGKPKRREHNLADNKRNHRILKSRETHSYARTGEKHRASTNKGNRHASNKTREIRVVETKKHTSDRYKNSSVHRKFASVKKSDVQKSYKNSNNARKQPVVKQRSSKRKEFKAAFSHKPLSKRGKSEKRNKARL